MFSRLITIHSISHSRNRMQPHNIGKCIILSWSAADFKDYLHQSEKKWRGWKCRWRMGTSWECGQQSNQVMHCQPTCFIFISADYSANRHGFNSFNRQQRRRRWHQTTHHLPPSTYIWNCSRLGVFLTSAMARFILLVHQGVALLKSILTHWR